MNSKWVRRLPLRTGYSIPRLLGVTWCRHVLTLEAMMKYYLHMNKSRMQIVIFISHLYFVLHCTVFGLKSSPAPSQCPEPLQRRKCPEFQMPIPKDPFPFNHLNAERSSPAFTGQPETIYRLSSPQISYICSRIKLGIMCSYTLF